MLKAYDLRCENLLNPIGLHSNGSIRFTWKLQSDNFDVVQSGFRIIVKDGSFVVCDTGEMITHEQSYCLEDTALLASECKYQVLLEVTDNTGEKTDSECIFMLAKKKSDWSAKWIGTQSDKAVDVQEPMSNEEMVRLFQAMVEGNASAFHPDRQLDPVYIFRREFYADDIDSAFLSITAHGVYEARINGKPVTDTLLNPGFTPYDSYLEFQTFDVADTLLEGKNVLTVLLADGWYKGKYGILGFGNNYGSETALILQLDMKSKNGTKYSVVSDESFSYTTSSIMYSDMLIGECVDTRIHDEKWFEPGVETKELKSAVEKNFDMSNLMGITTEPVRYLEEMQPVEIVRLDADTFLVDFGQVMVGTIRLETKGKTGDILTLEHSEVLNEDGEFINNISGANRDQKDIFYLNGKVQTVSPKFTFHGFRYAKITGYSGDLSRDKVSALVIGTDLNTTGGFSCSDERLNQLQSNIFWSQRGNMLSIPTDCPQRERAGWTGDILVYGKTASFNQNVYSFLRKWLHGARIEQFADGQIPVVIPYPKAYSALQMSTFGSDTSAGWGDAVIAVPWMLYQTYGDKRILEENWQMMKRWISYVENQAENDLPEEGNHDDAAWKARQRYLWNTGFHFGDWLYPSCKNAAGESDMFRSAYTTKEYVATAMYAQSCMQLIEIAGILGYEDDVSYYKDLLNNIRRAYAEEYIDKDGRISDAPQGVYVLTLAMKMGGEEQLRRVAKKLVGMIHENGDRLDTGFLSIPYLMDVLMQYGFADVTEAILYQDACPSWLYEVRNGATTMWERWDAITPDGHVTDSSYNHYAFGCIGDWMYRTLLGLKFADPGCGRAIIEPSFEFSLSQCSGMFDSRYGKYSVSWSIGNEGSGIINVEVPAGAFATIRLPGIEKEIGSGKYSFGFEVKKQ